MSTDLHPHRWSVQDSKGLPRGLGMFAQSWHDAVCTLMQENWNAILGEPVEVRVLAIDVNTCRKLLSQVPDPGYGAQFSIGPKGEQSLMACSAGLVKQLVADLLGIDAIDNDEEFHDLTPVELSMVELLFGETARALSQAWPQIQSLECHLDQIINRPLRSRLFAPDDELVRSRLEIISGDSRETVTWMTPLGSLEGLVGDTFTHDAQTPSTPAGTMEKIIEQVQLNLVVELGKAQISIRELEKLVPGDVIVLDQPANMPLRGCVGGEANYLGFACRIGGRQGFRVHGHSPK